MTNDSSTVQLVLQIVVDAINRRRSENSFGYGKQTSVGVQYLARGHFDMLGSVGSLLYLYLVVENGVGSVPTTKASYLHQLLS